MTFLSAKTEEFQLGAVGRLLGSEIYYSRLRRTLINDYDPKVTTDFLVLDGVAYALLAPFMGSDNWKNLVEIRKLVFSKALESVWRKLDVRVHDQLERLYSSLISHGNEVDGRTGSGRGLRQAEEITNLASATSPALFSFLQYYSAL